MTHDMRTRRSMVSGLGAAVAALAVGSRTAAAQTAAGQFQPARHAQDAWLDAVPGKHRTFIDAATYESNKSGYSLPEKDIVVVACYRHFATPFAFTDAMWAKYGKAFSMVIEFTDPKTKQAPSTNVLNAAGYGMQPSNFGYTIDSVTRRGTRFAVCDLATHFFAGQLAMMTKGNADAIYKELIGNRIPNSYMVAAGVLAVNRAQEYGYTLLNTL
ncbi:MAG: hypothetical protein DMF88_24625 [Acidobacteria bacterium]|nr:MAG: hypothetical protein DMF88_24625 [Acidobacteriota bacterium]